MKIIFLQKGLPVHATDYVDPILGEKVVLVFWIALAIIVVIVWISFRKDKKKIR